MSKYHRKPGDRVNEAPKLKNRQNLIQAEYQNQTYTRYVGVDPGLKQALAVYVVNSAQRVEMGQTLTSVDPRDTDEAHLVSSRWIRCESGVNKRRWRLRNLQAKVNRKIAEMTKKFPDLRLHRATIDFATTKWRLLYYREIGPLMRRAIWSRQTFDRKIRTRSTMDRLANELVYGDAVGQEKRHVSTFIALGQVAISNKMRGHARVPMKLLVQRLEEIAVRNPSNLKIFYHDEYLTTQLCGVCSHQMYVGTGKSSRRSDCLNEIGTRAVGETVRPLRCGKSWNRDIVAAKNILQNSVIACNLPEGPREISRPENFKRPQRATAADIPEAEKNDLRELGVDDEVLLNF